MDVWNILTLLLVLKLPIFARKIPEFLADENLRTLAVTNNDVMLRLYQRLANGTLTNVFFSPLSLSICFGMVLQGTNGDTKKELSSVLGYESVNLTTQQISASFDLLLSRMLYQSNRERSNYNLNIINKILVQENLGLLPSYKRLVTNLYRASIEEVNFQRYFHKIIHDVNEWARESTNGTIGSIVKEIEPNTIMTFLNAVYFKSAWKYPFPKHRTRPKIFYNNGLEFNAKNVPFMHIESKFNYASLSDVQVLELPYSGDKFSMFVILPSRLNGLSSIANLFMNRDITSIRKQLYTTNVKVSLPKFKINYSKDLSPELQAMGMRAIFKKGYADFSAMIASKNACVSRIKHKAAIDVNEKGSVAAAFTGMTMIAVRMPISLPPTPQFVADHPFMFLIIDQKSDMVLFAGQVNKM
ncbi:intracellular coagulation inhibitor 2 [Parasteatoda tepidariorum]|uniref:intracellular coagulation inhibitor 2 n=1 Tax=Parasteatoda tepidariorum TaxID=114398 RepID=UPI0039BD3734